MENQKSLDSEPSKATDAERKLVELQNENAKLREALEIKEEEAEMLGEEVNRLKDKKRASLEDFDKLAAIIRRFSEPTIDAGN